MKQTPIPEKIESKYKADYGFLVDYINSLIDVLTEQQKEIDILQYLEDKRQSRDAGESVGKQYTAMRSTGEYPRILSNDKMTMIIKGHKDCVYEEPIKPQEYCECKESIQCNSTRCINVIYQHCAKCEKQYKPIKEDVKNRDLEKMAMNIVYQIGDALSEAKAEDFVGKRQETNDKCIDFVYKILAIVKRE